MGIKACDCKWVELESGGVEPCGGCDQNCRLYRDEVFHHDGKHWHTKCLAVEFQTEWQSAEKARGEISKLAESYAKQRNGLSLRLGAALELLKKCVTSGYSRHEINCFLADSAPDVENLGNKSDATHEG
jgi:hypothetical protein